MSDDLYPYLGAKIRQAREASRLTQADLARRVQLSRSSIANIEAGRQAIYLHQAVMLAQALDQPLASLVPSPVDKKSREKPSESHIEQIIKDSEEYNEKEAS